MTESDYPPIIDGHADYLLSLDSTGRDFLEESDLGHVDLPRARKGGLGGLFCSVFLGAGFAEMNPVGYTMKYLDDMYTLIDRSEGQMRLVRDAPALDECIEDGTFANILHFEGAEPIGRTLRELRTWYEAGLRSLGFVHARENIFGNGAPLAPTDPDGYLALQRPVPGRAGRGAQTIRGWGLPRDRRLPYLDTGLTQVGVELIKECEYLGIIVDVSHMTDESFWDTVKVAKKPLIASHSSVRALCDQKRNLTDEMIEAIAEGGGTIGINFSMRFLSQRHRDYADLEGGAAEVTLDETADHFQHIIDLVGDEHVSFGSDYDGGIQPPPEISDCSKLGNLMAAFERRGYSADRMERIANGNFRRVAHDVWKTVERHEEALVGGD